MRTGILVCGLICIGDTALAQQAVQQPVVGSTSVGTSVSVPDRGRVSLGGVSSAQSGRTQFGPVPTGPASGLSRQGSSVSVSVYVHDLHAMDEALLKSAPPVTEVSRLKKTDSSTSTGSREKPAESDISPAEKVAKHERLARKADDEGRHTVARLHWQMAAKYGSKVAEEKLAQLKDLPKDGSFASNR